jgi:hypothetical protein
MKRSDISSAMASRSMEIDQLVYFIRTSDLHNARRSIVNLLGRGQRISREILIEYHRLETGLS